jgi:pimeloyl-ACP methyl ester carboxylesterase
MTVSRTEIIRLGTFEHRVRHWGDQDAPMLFMIHGWMDSAATFQFVVDAFEKRWHVVAPDLRGHGRSHRNHEPYFFMQFLADLDALLEYYSPANPVRLVGHSLGGNVGSVYSGCRPERISRLVNLEGLAPVPGHGKGTPEQIVSNWLNVLRKGVRNRIYAGQEEMAARLRRANPRLSPDRARFLAAEFGHREPDDRITFDVDPFQHSFTPLFEHTRLIESAWPRITAPVLLLTGADSNVTEAFSAQPQELQKRLGLLKSVQYVQLENAGHNLHHDQPERVAILIDEFLSD